MTANEVAEILRFLAGGWVSGEDNQRWLANVANNIEAGDISDQEYCPLCEEVTCDENCPCKPFREAESNAV